MYILFLGARYTLRRWVTLVAVVVLSLAIGALIVVWSIMSGFLRETQDFLRGTTSDLIVFPDQRDGPFPRAELERIASEHPAVQGVASRLVRPAVFKVAGADDSHRGMSLMAERTLLIVHGIDPEQELANTAFGSYLDKVEERSLRVEDAADPFALPSRAIRDSSRRYAGLPRVLMSEVLLSSMRLRKGDAIELVTVPDGVRVGSEEIRPASLTFVIAGAFNTGHYKFDIQNVFVPNADFKTWASTPHDLSELYLTVAPQADLEAVRGEVEQALAAVRLDSRVDTWRDRHQVWLSAVENERTILGFVFAFFLMLVSMIMLCILMGLVQSKVRDIGIISSMGASPWGIAGVFAMCGVVISVLSSLFGLLAGEFVAHNLAPVVSFVEWVAGRKIFDPTVYAFAEIPVEVNRDTNLFFASLAGGFGIVICLVPALFAALKNPVQALRHE